MLIVNVGVNANVYLGVENLRINKRVGAVDMNLSLDCVTVVYVYEFLNKEMIKF